MSFICSDIHGHFSIFEIELKKHNFCEINDRLFSLGDLIDRGNESNQVLSWLEKPWFNAIQGNHERMLINAVESESNALNSQWIMWGGDWAKDYNYRDLMQYYEKLSALPIAIEVNLQKNRKIGLVHAELPDICDWQEVCSLLSCIGLNDIEGNKNISNMLWNKSQPYYNIDQILDVKPVKNIDHVFHGHTILQDYYTLTNRTFMDLGSYESGRIGFVEIDKFLSQDLI